MNEIFEEIKRITESFIEDGERFIEERKAKGHDNIWYGKRQDELFRKSWRFKRWSNMYH